MIHERWCFTQEELDEIKKEGPLPDIRRDDVFLAVPYGMDVEDGFYADRNGEPNGQCRDGSFGFYSEPDGGNVLYKVIDDGDMEELQETVKWLDVMCNDDGEMVAIQYD